MITRNKNIYLVRKICLLLFLLVQMISLQAQEQNQAKQDTIYLTQRQAVELALEQNNSLKEKRLDVSLQKVNYKSQFARLLPTLDVSANYNHTLKKQRMYFGGEDSPMSKFFPEDGIEMGTTHNIQAGVRAAMPLVVPQVWASLGLSRRAVDLALEEARSSELKLKGEVQKAYVGLLLAKEVQAVLVKSLSNIETSYAQAKEKHKRGLIAEYDLLRLETQAKNLKPELIQAEENSLLAMRKLKVLLNLPLEKELVLKEHLLDAQDFIYKEVLGDEAEQDLDANPLLRKLDLQKQSLKASLRTKQMSFMPSLSLNFAYNYNYANNSLELDKSKRWSPYSMIGLNLNIPLFSGGSRFYELKGVKLQLEQLALQRLQAEREVGLALEQTFGQLRSAKEQFFASQLARTSASRGFTIAEARYNNGLSSLLELNDAELSLRQAELNLCQAIYKYLVATYQIEELKGRDF